MIIVNKILWAVATSFILLSSIYFTFKLKFLQLNIKEMFKSLKVKNNRGGLKPIQVLMMTLAGRIGIGSIAGIALAIYIGGIGSLFWIWVIAIFSSVLAYAETVLGIIYKEKDTNEIYKGGPSFYLKKGLGLKKLGGIYAILIIISYIGGFVGIQANTIVKSITTLVEFNPYIISLIIVLITCLIILGGVEKIASSTTKIVPIMGIFYLGMSFFIILKNINLMPSLILNILKSAFNFNSFFGGFLTTFIIGIQRGIFSTEAGTGTGSIAASTTNINEPTSQGYIQILGVYITSLLICTATSFVILLSNYTEFVYGDINGIEIVLYAFRYHLGNFGDIVVLISIFLFSFSTILTGYYYGEASLKYFFHHIKPIYLIILKLSTLLILFIGGIISANFLWNLIDIFVALLAIINIYAIICLKNDVISEYQYYKSKKCAKI